MSSPNRRSPRLQAPKPPHTRVILPPGRPPKCWDELKAAFLKAEENPKDKEYTVEAQRLKNRYEKEVCITLESRGGNCTHELFTGGWFLQANLTAQGQEITKSAEVNQYPGLLNCQKRYTLVCVMCYNDPSKSLDESLRTSTLYGTGNFCNHMNVKHKDIVYVKKRDSGDVSVATSASKRKRGDTDNVCSVGSTTIYESACSPVWVKERGEDMVYDFLAQCNVAGRHSNSEYLQRLIRHVADNPRFYSHRKNMGCLSKDRYTSLRVGHFTKFINFVTNVVN